MEELEMTAEESTEILKTNAEEITADSTTEEQAEEHSPEVKNEEKEEKEAIAAVDYGEIETHDLKELHALFPHLRDKTSILELDNPLRYAALRDLGLSPKEAYLATSEPTQKYDNRSHLRSSVPKSVAAPSDMLSHSELAAARELFSGLSDREIQKLYKKVARQQ